MSKHAYAAGSIAALLLFAHPNFGLCAQQSSPPQSEQRTAVLTDIQKSVARTFGAQESTVNVTVIGNVLVVTRVNSYLNNATHGARDNEAQAIAGIVSKAIAGKSEFNAIISLRVQYLARSAGDKSGTVVDTIEFREDPSGAFQFHKT